MSTVSTKRFLTAVAGALALSVSTSAWAIPSPDLVINLSASVAQLLGLVSVIFGGVAMRRKSSSGRRRRAGEGTPRIYFGVALVLLLGSVAGNAIQYSRSIDVRNERLQVNLVRKSVENGESVGDTSLKTLSFSDQLQHPQGVATETLAEWLDNDIPVNLIDVREAEEFEVGSIDGTTHLRYPDLLASSSLLPDSGAENARTVLLCYSGNRSSELCEGLTAQGKSCNFMVGGYEKWMTESRPLNSTVDTSLEQLRQLPEFANKDTLLDTPDVQKLVSEEGAQFIDVRYPNEFLRGHLPGARNITMRALGSEVLAERVEALPDTPLIAACYDKRSCFYSQLIGLRMERAGKDFRGRYTVPHEYYELSNSVRDHVAAWQANQSQLTLASYVVGPATSVVNKLAGLINSPILTLLVLVALIRILLFPLAVKAGRDTRVQKSLSQELELLKADLAGSARALTSSTMELLREHRVRPIASLFNSLLQLGATLLFYSAVSDAAANWEGDFLWAAHATTPDQLRAIPLAATLLSVAAISIQIKMNTTKRRIGLVAGSVFLFALLQALGIAVATYLALSMAALVVQTLLIARIGDARGWDTRGRQPFDESKGVEDTGLISLRDANRLPEAAGRKAARLGELIEAGFDVPPGFVMTEKFGRKLNQVQTDDSGNMAVPFTPEIDENIDALWSSLKLGKAAVRSSGANEDGSDSSFAGVYDSILNVDRAGLAAAAATVYASLDNARSTAYRDGFAAKDTDHVTETGGVLVQAMVDAEYAGVMFTEHPTSSGAMLVEMVAGLGEDLVSGSVTPDTFKYGKVSGALDQGNSDIKPPIDFGPLLDMGRRVEAHFGAPQDIEWAFANGRFQLLQARDITRSITSGDNASALIEKERARLLSELCGRRRYARRGAKDPTDTALLVQSELSELLPRPTPVSADLMQRLWEAGGATDLACQELGVPYAVHKNSAPFVTTLFGWTYVNKEEEARRVGSGPGALAVFRLSRDADAMANAYLEDFLPRFRSEMIERNAINFDALSLDTALSLLDSWVERFVTETYVEAERINIAASLHMATAREKLAKADIDPANVLGADADSIAAGALALLSGGNVSESQRQEFLMSFGHRAPLDYELSHPRFNEDDELVQQYIERSVNNTPHNGSATSESDNSFDGKPILKVVVDRARRYQTLKEDAKHYSLIELAQIRQLLLSIDRAVSLDGRVFHLQIDEILSLHDESKSLSLVAIADQRMEDSRAWASLQAPVSLSLDDLERMNLATGELASSDISAATEKHMRGTRVAGSGTLKGQARVIVDVSQIDTFMLGEVLVARMTDPTWYPLFGQASGIVTEIGGWLSHAAIVAREFNLPTIVGAIGATSGIKTGDVVSLHPDGSITIEVDQRELSQPQPVSEPAKGSNVHVLDDLRRFRFTAMERRAMKGLAADRRSEVRADANGNPQPGRRALDRNANLSVYRKAA